MAVLGVGSYGYQVGVSAHQARTDQLEADLARFQHANLDLRDQIALTRQQSEPGGGGARGHARALRRRDPERRGGGSAGPDSGAARRAGVEPERLAFLIEAAALDDACRGRAGDQALHAAHADQHRAAQLRPLRRPDHDHRGRRVGAQRGGPARGLVRPGPADPARVPDPGRRDHDDRGNRAVDPPDGGRRQGVSVQRRQRRAALHRDDRPGLRPAAIRRRRPPDRRARRRMPHASGQPGGSAHSHEADPCGATSSASDKSIQM